MGIEILGLPLMYYIAMVAKVVGGICLRAA